MTPKLYDVTLRDGNHALRHQIDSAFLRKYCEIADSSSTYAVEVGHGNGLGASSYLVGKARLSDAEMLRIARDSLKSKKLAVHAIPGFATIERDLKPALDLGVDLFRIATHATEATLSETHIHFLRDHGVEVQGVLMMSHMNSPEGLLEQARMMVEFGATAIVLMDSAGSFLPSNVDDRIGLLNAELDVEIGFHAHNNFGMAIANASAATASGASIIDGASMGLGAGSGNAQLESIAAVYNRDKIANFPLDSFYLLSDITRETYEDQLPVVSSASLRSGLEGAFSGYAPFVEQLSAEFGLPVDALWKEIGKRKLVAGQETILREIAIDLMNL